MSALTSWIAEVIRRVTKRPAEALSLMLFGMVFRNLWRRRNDTSRGSSIDIEASKNKHEKEKSTIEATDNCTTGNTKSKITICDGAAVGTCSEGVEPEKDTKDNKIELLDQEMARIQNLTTRVLSEEGEISKNGVSIKISEDVLAEDQRNRSILDGSALEEVNNTEGTDSFLKEPAMDGPRRLGWSCVSGYSDKSVNVYERLSAVTGQMLSEYIDKVALMDKISEPLLREKNLNNKTDQSNGTPAENLEVSKGGVAVAWEKFLDSTGELIQELEASHEKYRIKLLEIVDAKDCDSNSSVEDGKKCAGDATAAAQSSHSNGECFAKEGNLEGINQNQNEKPEQIFQNISENAPDRKFDKAACAEAKEETSCLMEKISSCPEGVIDAGDMLVSLIQNLKLSYTVLNGVEFHGRLATCSYNTKLSASGMLCENSIHPLSDSNSTTENDHRKGENISCNEALVNVKDYKITNKSDECLKGGCILNHHIPVSDARQGTLNKKYSEPQYEYLQDNTSDSVEKQRLLESSFEEPIETKDGKSRFCTVSSYTLLKDDTSVSSSDDEAEDGKNFKLKTFRVKSVDLPRLEASRSHGNVTFDPFRPLSTQSVERDSRGNHLLEFEDSFVVNEAHGRIEPTKSDPEDGDLNGDASSKLEDLNQPARKLLEERNECESRLAETDRETGEIRRENDVESLLMDPGRQMNTKEPMVKRDPVKVTEDKIKDEDDEDDDLKKEKGVDENSSSGGKEGKDGGGAEGKDGDCSEKPRDDGAGGGSSGGDGKDEENSDGKKTKEESSEEEVESEDEKRDETDDNKNEEHAEGSPDKTKNTDSENTAEDPDPIQITEDRSEKVKTCVIQDAAESHSRSYSPEEEKGKEADEEPFDHGIGAPQDEPLPVMPEGEQDFVSYLAQNFSEDVKDLFNQTDSKFCHEHRQVYRASQEYRNALYENLYNTYGIEGREARRMCQEVRECIDNFTLFRTPDEGLMGQTPPVLVEFRPNPPPRAHQATYSYGPPLAPQATQTSSFRPPPAAHQSTSSFRPPPAAHQSTSSFRSPPAAHQSTSSFRPPPAAHQSTSSFRPPAAHQSTSSFRPPAAHQSTSSFRPPAAHQSTSSFRPPPPPPAAHQSTSSFRPPAAHQSTSSYRPPSARQARREEGRKEKGSPLRQSRDEGTFQQRDQASWTRFSSTLNPPSLLAQLDTPLTETEQQKKERANEIFQTAMRELESGRAAERSEQTQTKLQKSPEKKVTPAELQKSPKKKVTPAELHKSPKKKVTLAKLQKSPKKKVTPAELQKSSEKKVSPIKIIMTPEIKVVPIEIKMTPEKTTPTKTKKSTGKTTPVKPEDPSKMKPRTKLSESQMKKPLGLSPFSSPKRKTPTKGDEASGKTEEGPTYSKKPKTYLDLFNTLYIESNQKVVAEESESEESIIEESYAAEEDSYQRLRSVIVRPFFDRVSVQPPPEEKDPIRTYGKSIIIRVRASEVNVGASCSKTPDVIPFSPSTKETSEDMESSEVQDDIDDVGAISIDESLQEQEGAISVDESSQEDSSLPSPPPSPRPPGTHKTLSRK